MFFLPGKILVDVVAVFYSAPMRIIGLFSAISASVGLLRCRCRFL